MRLHDLKPRPGAKHRRKRLGAGESSGRGKTAGKGHKGQKARAGSFGHGGFEGGQMPIYRQLPRRGFNNARFHKTWAVINVSSLEEWFKDGDTVTEASLREQGRVKGSKWAGVKILGNGDIKKKLTVVADKVSASAQSKIEAAGGKVEMLAPKPVEPKGKGKKATKEAKPAKKEAAPVKETAKKEEKAEKLDFGPDSHLPLEDPQEIPAGFPVKGNADSMLFHREDSRMYGRTIAEVYFKTPEAAETAGFKLAGTHPADSDE